MGTLLLLCGRPFSGKSTLAARLVERQGAVVVSFDAINLERGLLGGDGLPLAEWARTLEIAEERTAAALRTHRLVVVDDTLCFRWMRDAFRSLAAAVGASTVLVFLDPPHDVLGERRERNRLAPTRPDVAASVLDAHLAAFEDPGTDETAVSLRSPVDVERWLQTFVP